MLDGFYQHFQASAHYPLTCAVYKSQQHRNKFSGMPRIKPKAVGVWSKNASSAQCSPLPIFKLTCLPLQAFIGSLKTFYDEEKDGENENWFLHRDESFRIYLKQIFDEEWKETYFLITTYKFQLIKHLSDLCWTLRQMDPINVFTSVFQSHLQNV